MTFVTAALCALAIGVGLLGLRAARLITALALLGIAVAWSGSQADAVGGALACFAAVGLWLLSNHLERRHEEVHGDDQDY